MAKTTAEIATLLGTEANVANGFVTVLRNAGVIVQTGIYKHPDRKIGKGAALYALTEDGEAKWADILAKLKTL